MTDCDSPYEHIRQRSEAVFTQEINLSMHLSVGYILVDMPETPSGKIDNFAAVLNRYLANNIVQQKFILRLTLTGDEEQDEMTFSGSETFNQDTVRDNFSSITLLIDSAFDGTGCPGGAIPNLLMGSQNGTQVLLEMVKKGTK